jgi:SAM-dependent methyltransferase
MTDIALLEKHYASVSEADRVSETRARRLEFDTTLHFLDKYLDPRATILELGAGVGTYGLHFARRGHRVLSTDLVPLNVERLGAQVEKEGLGTIQVRQADPTRLEALSDWDFQAVLCLGPYGHLRTREQRRRCLLECRRVAHDRGLVAVSYLNRAFAIASLLRRGLALSPEQYDSFLTVDDRRIDYPDPFFNVAHFTTPEAVEAEVRSCGYEILEHVGTDGTYEFVADAFEGLDADAYLNYLSYHLKTCSSVSQRGASRRGLVILRKV